MFGPELAFVVAAGVFTALVCGVGALPFIVVDELGDRLTDNEEKAPSFRAGMNPTAFVHPLPV